MKKLILWRLLAGLVLLGLSGCVGWYPIKDHLSQKVPEQKQYVLPYMSSNLFQLRIAQSTEFLPVGFRTVTDRDTVRRINLVSDFPFKRFQQMTSKQDSIPDPEHLVVDETYLYLDKFNQENGERSEKQFGYAFYFITYPVIDKNNEVKKKRRYYNNPAKLYSNLIRYIRIGLWLTSPEGELMLIFKNLNNKYSFYLGKPLFEEIYPTKSLAVEIEKISHPYNLSAKRIDEVGLLNFIVSPRRIGPFIVFREGLDLSDEERKNIFNSIKSSIAPIEIKNVLGLDDRGLLFYNILPSKQFIYEEIQEENDTIDRLIKNFTLGKFTDSRDKPRMRFYFGLELNDTVQTYHFGNKISYIN